MKFAGTSSATTPPRGKTVGDGFSMNSWCVRVLDGALNKQGQEGEHRGKN
jgi:hypothetical protein